MNEHLGSASNGAGNAQRWLSDRTVPSGSRMLMVGADLHWSRAVRNVARDLTGSGVDAVPSGGAALARLLDRQGVYSHVLMNPARDDGLLKTILALTDDEKNSGTSLLLLGRTAAAPSHACVIPGPSHQAIRTALTMGCAGARATPPSIAMLRTALGEQRIDTRYQPLVRLTDREPAGLEALARLYHVGHGMIAPEYFVPRIEDAGLAAELTRLVTARSLADLNSPAMRRHDEWRIALNFPLDVLLMPGELRRLDAEREAAGIAASRIVIELTESRAVTDLPPLRRVVERLRRIGYLVAIDDMSPAMPRHAALLDLPFSAVKLDKDIVMRGSVSKDAADFVERIIAMAKARRLTVIVEGVQDLRTWNRVRRAGADLAQGYAITQPLPVAVLPAWVDAWRARTEFD
jgi:EAL domain-containing protein (putative c-di-GMP-specific phosphodiesterase class I)